MAQFKRIKSDASKALKTALETPQYKTSVGWGEGAKYPDGTPVAAIAAQNEFGNASKRIPPRSFVRTTITEKEEEWRNLALSGARAVVAGNTSVENVMEGLGIASQGDIGKKITQIQEPALSPVTIKARQRKLADGKKVGNLTKPLIETSQMLSTLTYSVEKK